MNRASKSIDSKKVKELILTSELNNKEKIKKKEKNDVFARLASKSIGNFKKFKLTMTENNIQSPFSQSSKSKIIKKNVSKKSIHNMQKDTPLRTDKKTIKENLKEKDNKKKDENKSNDKVEEEEEDQVEVDPEIIKKLNHVMKYEDDSDRYIDPEDQTLKDNLPLYLVDILRNEIKWKRPKKYILHHFLWEKVKMVFPKKKMSVICEEIIDTYKDYLLKIINGEILNYEDDEEQNLNEYLSDQNASIKNRIYKEFFPIIDQDYDIKIADSFQRLENEAEYHKRIEIDNNINNNLNIEDKNKKKTLKKINNKKIGKKRIIPRKKSLIISDKILRKKNYLKKKLYRRINKKAQAHKKIKLKYIG